MTPSILVTALSVLLLTAAASHATQAAGKQIYRHTHLADGVVLIMRVSGQMQLSLPCGF